jgi:hypothetical protein
MNGRHSGIERVQGQIVEVEDRIRLRISYRSFGSLGNGKGWRRSGNGGINQQELQGV